PGAEKISASKGKSVAQRRTADFARMLILLFRKSACSSMASVLSRTGDHAGKTETIAWEAADHLKIDETSPAISTRCSRMATVACWRPHWAISLAPKA
ncbi:MAG: hypothetical protein ACJ8FU_02585, partial [Xanthobacteraceae bacterium]